MVKWLLRKFMEVTVFLMHKTLKIVYLYVRKNIKHHDFGNLCSNSMDKIFLFDSEYHCHNIKASICDELT